MFSTCRFSAGPSSALLALSICLTFAGQLTASLMNLPDGIENILGFVPKSNFQCERDGYFGDVENECRLFHLCQKSFTSTGRLEWRHWTYACGNQTMFNQLTLTCAFVDEAIPCKHAGQFQYLNEVIHRPREPFLTDADVTSGFSYYTNRIMSDGARARAFQDSQLLAQLGGSQPQELGAISSYEELPLSQAFQEAVQNENNQLTNYQFVPTPNQMSSANSFQHQGEQSQLAPMVVNSNQPSGSLWFSQHDFQPTNGIQQQGNNQQQASQRQVSVQTTTSLSLIQEQQPVTTSQPLTIRNAAQQPSWTPSSIPSSVQGQDSFTFTYETDHKSGIGSDQRQQQATQPFNWPPSDSREPLPLALIHPSPTTTEISGEIPARTSGPKNQQLSGTTAPSAITTPAAPTTTTTTASVATSAPVITTQGAYAAITTTTAGTTTANTFATQTTTTTLPTSTLQSGSTATLPGGPRKSNASRRKQALLRSSGFESARISKKLAGVRPQTLKSDATEPAFQKRSGIIAESQQPALVMRIQKRAQGERARQSKRRRQLELAQSASQVGDNLRQAP